MKKSVTIIQDENKPVAVEVMAKAILAISEGIKKLRAGPLNDRALVLLIQNAAPNVGGKYGSSPLTQKEVRAVLEGIEGLAATYLKPGKKE